MYGMTNSEKKIADEITNSLIDEAVFNQSKCQMSIYYKYVPNGSRSFVLSYVDDCVYCYSYEEVGK